MKFNRLLIWLFVILSYGIFQHSQAEGTSAPHVVAQPPDYDETGRPLPPGVPKVVDTNGKTLYIFPHFTTRANHDEALQLVTQEANKVAKQLELPENLPITESNLAGYHIGPFDFNYSHRSLGYIETKKYCYYVAAG